RKIQLEEYENIGQMLEGTGSMVIDRPNRLVYACLSPRTHPALLERFCKLMKYEAVPFHAIDADGLEIYHTNVMMALGETFAIICLGSVPDYEETNLLKKKFKESKKEIIEISMEQMMSFAGNMLQVRGEGSSTYLVMSETAFRSLTEHQVEEIRRHTNILFSPIPTIETYGGGSVRCMMAEVFLPEK
ncbi:MAG: arginine deiminase-related protein, partial [Saprospiraceae bacterium]